MTRNIHWIPQSCQEVVILMALIFLEVKDYYSSIFSFLKEPKGTQTREPLPCYFTPDVAENLEI